MVLIPSPCPALQARGIVVLPGGYLGLPTLKQTALRLAPQGELHQAHGVLEILAVV